MGGGLVTNWSRRDGRTGRDALFGGPVTGASMNPALGAALARFTYRFLRGEDVRARARKGIVGCGARVGGTGDPTGTTRIRGLQATKDPV